MKGIYIMKQKSNYRAIKELLLCEFNIDFVRCQVNIGTDAQPDKYMLLKQDNTLAYPEPITIDLVIEWLTQNGFSITDYE